MKKLELNPDIDWIIDGLRNGELGELYLDIQTGEVILISNDDDDETSDLDPQELMSNEPYLKIPNFCDSIRDLKKFIDSIQDVKLRSQVTEAFYQKSKGGFKRVKAIVGNDWDNFEYLQIASRFKSWLKSQEIEIIDER
ncbi:hypothetical protein FJR11_20610 [Anabaena sp. UHCC 0187]|uniref:UPF0158 family protein n=1 Tax=Anabaena sp. UHCC 0187 TaxID=2590018 RepID=UPI001446DF72|nr:UPF0158 family protein [Anabaena sp. UHCC 0187]MTJ14935.1 hypothetical protein [Anabaena sp. UHCC 0187]